MVSYANRSRTISSIIDGIERSIKDCSDEIDNIDIAPEAQNAGSGAQACLEDITSDIADLRIKLDEIKGVLE